MGLGLVLVVGLGLELGLGFLDVDWVALHIVRFLPCRHNLLNLATYVGRTRMALYGWAVAVGTIRRLLAGLPSCQGPFILYESPPISSKLLQSPYDIPLYWRKRCSVKGAMPLLPVVELKPVIRCTNWGCSTSWWLMSPAWNNNINVDCSSHDEWRFCICILFAWRPLHSLVPADVAALPAAALR